MHHLLGLHRQQESLANGNNFDWPIPGKPSEPHWNVWRASLASVLLSSKNPPYELRSTLGAWLM
jgi:hypothetical protein